MSYLKTKGIVIREVNTGDADKIITLLTDNRGKISVFLKNARRMKNKAIASSQLFCYSDFVLFKGKDLYSLNSSETIEAFYNIRCELVKLTYASHILEIINDTAQEGQSAFSMQKLLLNTLFMLNKNNINDELITRIFELRLMKILGFSPSIDSCIRCAKI
jgi:DNA repair protein RecO (recombination protein O)